MSLHPAAPSSLVDRSSRAVIVDHTPEGIPFVDFFEEISATGNFPDFEAFAAARCAFLTDP